MIYEKERKPFVLRDVHRIAQAVTIESQADALFSLAALGALVSDQLRWELEQSLDVLSQIFAGQLGSVAQIVSEVIAILKLISGDNFNQMLGVAFERVPEAIVSSTVEV